jgi:hypothetical protein
MIEINYRNAYKEVYTILKNLKEEDYAKIPPELIKTIESNMNEEYEYEMNEEVDIFKQPMLPETKATLYNIFRDYLATPEQKEKILKMQAEDRKKIELKKQEKYEYEDLLKNRNSNFEASTQQTSLIKVKKLNFFQKLLNKIKQLFIK